MLQYAKNLKYTKLNLVNKIVKQISVKHFSFHDVEKYTMHISHIPVND